MVDVTIAHVNEYDALGQLMWEAIHAGPSRYSPAQRTAWLPAAPTGAAWAERLDSQQIWVVGDGAPQGFVTLTRDGYVDFAYVHPSVQGRGVFRALMAALEQAARDAGHPRLWTHASLMAQPAFAALGFAVIQHEQIARAGHTLHRAEMEKSLT